MTRQQEVLKNFVEEQFDIDMLHSIGFFDDKTKRDDYQKQSERICRYFGLESIYQYGFETITAHITYDGERPEGAEFVEEFKAWHEYP